MSKSRAVETEPESTLRKAMNTRSMSKARAVETEPESTLRNTMNTRSMSIKLELLRLSLRVLYVNPS